MLDVKIGGVPEHFNYLWQYGLKKGYFEKAGINLLWQDFPGGTGAMAHALKAQELDLGILLTEGAVKEIVEGAPFKIVKPYVRSPLVWGIHTGENNTLQSLDQLLNATYAISRFNSGSHLMAYVYAKQKNLTINDSQMKVVGNIDGARKALISLEADIFFWEKLTTKPYVDNGEMRLLGEFPTPWPCFMLVAHTHFTASKNEVIFLIGNIIDTIQNELRKDLDLSASIAQMYQLKKADVTLWLNSLEWASGYDLKKNTLETVLQALLSLQMIPQEKQPEELVHSSIQLVS